MFQQLFICLGLLTFITAPSFAGDQRDFSYTGRPEESLELRTFTSETRYRERQVQDTCYRDEPYQERVCRNITRYRQSCHTQPGRRVCHNTPPRRVCRVRNGRRVCSTIPGRRVCRTEPGRRVCRNIPYTERVCRTETRYRRVPYSCTRTVREPYEVQIDNTARVSVLFEGNSTENHDFQVTLDNSLGVNIIQTNSTSTVAILVDTNRNVQRGNTSVVVDVTFRIKLLKEGRLLFRGYNFSDAVLGKESKVLYLDYTKWGNQSFNLNLIVTRNGKSYFSKNFYSDNEAVQVDDVRKTVSFNLRELGLSKKVRKGDYSLSLTLKRDVAGQVLTPGSRNFGKVYASSIETR